MASGGVTIRNAFPKLQVIKLPATLLTLALFTATGAAAQLSDSVYKQSANGLQISIGSTSVTTRDGGITIGTNTTVQGVDGIAIGTGSSSREGASVSIGHLASCPNSGLGTPNSNIAIGENAISGSSNPGAPTIAIGPSSQSRGIGTVAIGPSAICGPGLTGSIALGFSATPSLSREIAIGDNTAPITLVTVRAGVNVMVAHRSGGTGGWGINDAVNVNTIFRVDEDTVAGNSRLLLWDVTAGALKRVKIGPAGSGPGGVGQALFI